MIWAWMVTSSAVVGSSAISSLGEHDSAMAIITRWRMPAGERVRVVLGPILGVGDLGPVEHLDGDPPGVAPARCRWAHRSATWLPTVKAGLRLVIGSWKIMAISLPRTRRRSLGLSP